MTFTAYISNLSQEFKSGIAKDIAERYGLTFVTEDEAATAGVCFANKNDELRDDFKQVFTAIDLLHYLYAVVHALKGGDSGTEFPTIALSEIPFPEDATAFWNTVKLGSQMRQSSL